MRIVLIIKALALMLVLGAVGLTVYLVKEFNGSVHDLPGAMLEHQRVIENRFKEKAKQGGRGVNEPGEKAFQRANELLTEGSMIEAEEKRWSEGYRLSVKGIERLLDALEVD